MESPLPLANDPIVNVVLKGIKDPIRLLIENAHFPAALALTYSGIDTMAYLDLPNDRNRVHGVDFEAWCDRYIQFPGPENVSGLELYGARCGVLHTHSATSDLSRAGKVREVFYADRISPPVLYDPASSSDIVFISISALTEAFFAGTDRFLVEVFADQERASIVNERFESLLHSLPFGDQEQGDA